jgi:hypothetical protein
MGREGFFPHTQTAANRGGRRDAASQPHSVLFARALVADNTPRESHSSLLVLFYLGCVCGWDEFAAAGHVFIGRRETSFVTSLWQQITGCPQAALYLSPRFHTVATSLYIYVSLAPRARRARTERVSAIKVSAAAAQSTLSDAGRATCYVLCEFGWSVGRYRAHHGKNCTLPVHIANIKTISA